MLTGFKTIMKQGLLFTYRYQTYTCAYMDVSVYVIKGLKKGFLICSLNRSIEDKVARISQDNKATLVNR